MPLPSSCAGCTMHKPDNLCVAHSPSPTTVALEVAKWPMREPTSVCAEGSIDKQPITCGECLYWWTPDGQPLPEKTSNRTALWSSWQSRKEDRMFCVHHTASPGADSVMFYPRVTYKSDGCGSGKTPEQVLAEADKR